MKTLIATYIGSLSGLIVGDSYTFKIMYIEDSEITIKFDDDSFSETYSNVFQFLDSWTEIISL